MNRFNAVVVFMVMVFCSVMSHFHGFYSGKKDQQKTIESEVYKRCLDSNIYNEFQCYNMIIKGK